VRQQSGASLLELLAVLAIVGIAVMVMALNLRPAEAPVQTAARLVEGFILQARSTAIATTSAYRVMPDGEKRLTVDYAGECDDATWTPEPHSVLELPRDVTMSDTGWSVCFTRRGISTANVIVTLSHPDRGSSQVEVLLGGGTRVIL
jgi:Tfp pilus assembly protein FimT